MVELSQMSPYILVSFVYVITAFNWALKLSLFTLKLPQALERHVIDLVGT